MKGWRARIGLLYPASGLVDDEFYRLVPPGVSVHIARVGAHGNISAEKVKAFSEVDNLIRCAKDLEPIRPTCIAWACTSGSFLVGKEGSRRQVAALAQNTGTKCTNTSESMVEALHHLGVKRIGVGTPYPDDFNAPIVKFLEDHGFEVLAIDNLRLKNDWEIGSATPETIYALARRVAVERTEAVFLSCTGLDAVDLIEPMERDLGRPVLTANQVTMWNALRLSEISTRGLEQFGSLFAESAAEELATATSHH
jgi:maleate isomerase